MRTRCSAPVTGLRIGSPIASSDAGDLDPRAARIHVDVEIDRME